MNISSIAGSLCSSLALCCWRAASPAPDGGKPLKHEEPERHGRQVQHPARHRLPAAGQLRAGARRSSSARSSRTRRIRTCTPASRCSTTAPATPKLADKHFREALRLAPDKPDIINNYAIYLCKNGRVDEGVERFVDGRGQQVLSARRRSRYTNAGVCLRGAKRLDEAADRVHRRAPVPGPTTRGHGAARRRCTWSAATAREAARWWTRTSAHSARTRTCCSPPSAWRAPRKDRMAEEKYSRALRLEFPDSAQARALAAQQLSSMDETAAPATAPEARPIGAAPESRTIGQRLRAGRERSGLSVAAAAEKLHLDPKVIEALEADRFAELGASGVRARSPASLRGFRGRARRGAGGVYTARERARPPPPDLTQVPQPERRSDPRRLVTPLRGARRRAVLLALAIWWVLAGSNPTSRHGGAPARGAREIRGPVPADHPAPHAVHASRPRRRAGQRKPAATRRGRRRDRPRPGAGRVTEQAAPPRARRVCKLELANDSWVEVYDSRGERLFYDVASAGSVQSVEGRPPLRVVLGNAAGVVVEVDGRRARFPANALDGEGARFVVNRSGSLSRAR